MAEKRNSSVTVSERGEFVFTRVFDAPCALVFKAWTDPKVRGAVVGPKNFTNPVCKMDLRPAAQLAKMA